MPFTKGQSGNPKGRKPKGFTMHDSFARLGGKDGKQYAEQLHQLAVGKHDDVHARLKALAIIAPYIWGRPIERHEVSGPGGGPIATTVIHEHHAD